MYNQDIDIKTAICISRKNQKVIDENFTYLGLLKIVK